jgi:hypothetical protein
MKMPKVRSPTVKMGSSFPAAYTDGNAFVSCASDIERGVENLFALSPSGFPISNYPSSVVHRSLQRERIALADRAVKPGFGHPPLALHRGRRNAQHEADLGFF